MSHLRIAKPLAGAFAAILGLFLSNAAMADPIGPTCGTCQGATYWVQYSGAALPDSDPMHETFRIFLTIDTSTLNIPGVFGIGAAAVKVSAQSTGATLFQAPGGTGNWAIVNGGINAGGCSGSGSGFECASWTGAEPSPSRALANAGTPARRKGTARRPLFHSHLLPPVTFPS
jgi:hypothetical protein